MTTIDPAKVKVRASLNHNATLLSIAFDAEGGRLLAGGNDNAIHVFDAADLKKAAGKWTKHENYVSALVCLKTARGPVAVSGSYDRHLIWWDAKTGTAVRRVEAHQGWVRDMAATPDGKVLVSVGDDMRVKVWEAATGKLIRTLEGHAKETPQGHVTALYAVTISPDGKHIASGDRIGEVRVWELVSGKLAQRFEVPVLYTYDPRQRKRSIGGIRSLAFANDGKTLAVGGIGQVGNVDGLAGPAHVELWDWQKPRRLATGNAQGHKGLVNALRFDASGTWLIGAGGGSDNAFLAFWKMDKLPGPDKDNKATLAGQRIKSGGHIHRICLHPARDELFAVGYRKVEVWGLGK